MPNNSPGKCPLCFKTIVVKNFKRHCKSCHSSVNTQEKLDKLFLKFKEGIDSNSKQSLSSGDIIYLKSHQLIFTSRLNNNKRKINNITTT